MESLHNALSIYIHVPFCTTKCSYCAFNVYTHLESRIPDYIRSLLREIRIVGESNPGFVVHTIYLGGGTPTLLEERHFEQILATINRYFTVLPDAEITSEANPNDLLAPAKVQAIRQLGVNRLSIGVQSANQGELDLFGRLHDISMVEVAVGNARDGGFTSINLDLIYGIPDQSMADWHKSLDFILGLNPDHLSLYALGIEPKTAMEYWMKNGKLTAPDDDLSADMYESASDILDEWGFTQYEISNWAKPGHESIHNLQYWRNLPYLGLGPGAHGYANKQRYEVVRSPWRYIDLLRDDTAFDRFPITPAVEHVSVVDRETELSETIMMGLRLLQDGINLQQFEQRFGVSLLTLRAVEIENFIQHGFLELDNSRLRLTATGRFVSNRILRDLI